MKDQLFNFKLSKEHKEKLERIAKKESRTKGGMICRWIEAYPEVELREGEKCQKAG